MNKQPYALFEKFNVLNERERVMVILLTVVAIIIVFTEFIISPLTKKYDVAEKQINTLRIQGKQLSSQISVLRSKQSRDPDFQEKQKIKLLNEQVANLNLQLKEKMHGLVEPRQMAKVLESVLTQNTDLKLQRIQSLMAEPLSATKVIKGEPAEKSGIYRHGMQVEFKGSYLSMLKYLKTLDELPWNFYWDVLELNVDNYPVSTIIITVHTLSFHEGWIGV